MKIDDFAVYNSETLYNKNIEYSKENCYEIYGKTTYGLLFEKDMTKEDIVLLHVGDGIKKSTNDIPEGFFFSKNNNYSSYNDYKDFAFNEKSNLSKEYIINIIKRYIYMQNPWIWETTLIGGKKGILENPNWMFGNFILEDKKEYTIIKKYNTVKVFKGKQNIYAFYEKEEYCSFKLDEELYKKAIKLNSLSKSIIFSIEGIINIEDMKAFINIYQDLDKATKIE